MLPLALTSTTGSIRRLGGKRWQMLHRLIYFSAAAGVIHYIWLVKKDIREPVKDAIVLGLLLSYRIVVWGLSLWKKRPRVAPVSVGSAAE
jgi:methionine sulfoxide reductase heme-binding subunit